MVQFNFPLNSKTNKIILFGFCCNIAYWCFVIFGEFFHLQYFGEKDFLSVHVIPSILTGWEWKLLSNNNVNDDNNNSEDNHEEPQAADRRPQTQQLWFFSFFSFLFFFQISLYQCYCLSPQEFEQSSVRGSQSWCWLCLNAGPIQISRTNLGENHV